MNRFYCFFNHITFFSSLQPRAEKSMRNIIVFSQESVILEIGVTTRTDDLHTDDTDTYNRYI